MTCNPVPTANANNPSRAVPARSAMASVTDSGNAHAGNPTSSTSTAGDVFFSAGLFGVTRPVPARVVPV